jgi:hypothetical protein
MVNLIEEECKYLEYLEYQISLKNKFENVVRKIPMFKSKIQEGHTTVLKMINKMEDVRRREIYNILINEFNRVFEKN